MWTEWVVWAFSSGRPFQSTVELTIHSNSAICNSYDEDFLETVPDTKTFKTHLRYPKSASLYIYHKSISNKIVISYLWKDNCKLL